MKKFILILAVFTFASAYTPFCSGFKAGYKAGYCHGQSYCLEPLAPLCPLPNIGERTYMDGYDRGFLVGLSAR
jgi:hypothetical protein